MYPSFPIYTSELQPFFQDYVVAFCANSVSQSSHSSCSHSPNRRKIVTNQAFGPLFSAFRPKSVQEWPRHYSLLITCTPFSVTICRRGAHNNLPGPICCRRRDDSLVSRLLPSLHGGAPECPEGSAERVGCNCGKGPETRSRRQSKVRQ